MRFLTFFIFEVNTFYIYGSFEWKPHRLRSPCKGPC